MHSSTFANIHADKIELLGSMIPEYTEHLNQVRFFYTQLESFEEIFNHNGSTDYVPMIDELKEQLDYNGFLTICYLDLLVTSKNLLGSKDYWEEVYYLRHGYLIIYEAFRTYEKHSARINKLISSKYSSLNTELKDLSKSIREYKQIYDYDNTIDQIRDKITAHIDFNFLEYFQKISGFDIEKATWSIIDFIDLLNRMQSLSRSLVREADNTLKDKASQFDRYLQKLMNDISDRFSALNKSLHFQ